MLHENSALLVKALESCPLLDNRYKKIQLANVKAGAKQGYFSLVFKAFDEVEQRTVALKFFDQDPAKQDPYRLKAFEREHEILLSIQGVSRCLQVASPLCTYGFQISVPGGGIFTVPVKYFATDWLEGSLDHYFLDPKSTAALEKLEVFNEIVLAVESLHRRELAHRDLKSDNVRRKSVAEDVVVIDLGTAARCETTPTFAMYGHPVGHTRYAAPEAFCGFAGCREIARQSDIYALGAMLFELFASDDFYSAMRALNPRLDQHLLVAASKVDKSKDADQNLKSWLKATRPIFSGVMSPKLQRSGSTAPACISDQLDDLIEVMTKADVSSRTASLRVVRGMIWSLIRCVANDAFSKKRAAEQAARRQERVNRAIAKAARAEKRLAMTLEGAHGNA